MKSKSTPKKIKNQLWKILDTFRGIGEINEYKKLVMSLLFLKRINDQFDENVRNLIKEGLSEKEALEPHRHLFYVPPEARWEQITKSFLSIGKMISRACLFLEKSNPDWEYMLTDVNYNNSSKFPDGLLGKLIWSIGELNFSNDILENKDVFGQIYESLIGEFAASSGRKEGEFFTPREIVRLLIEILEPQEGMSICDPTCGTGGMLIESSKYVEAHGGNSKNLSLDGQESNQQYYNLCKMNLILHEIKNYRLELGDILKNPKLIDNGKLKKYDRIFANFPFSMRWDNQEAVSDPYGRFKFGIPPKGKADFAFIQHVDSTLKSKGKAVVICSQGILFRSGTEALIRRQMIEQDVIEAVIALPQNLFYGTRIPVYALILNKNKSKLHKQKILFIYAVNDYQKGKSRNVLRTLDIYRIKSIYQNFKNIPGYSRVIDIKEIRNNDFSLSIPKYLKIKEIEKISSIQLKQKTKLKVVTADDEIKRARELLKDHPQDVVTHLRTAIELSIVERFEFNGIKSMYQFLKVAEKQQFPLPSYDLIYKYYDAGSKRIHQGISGTEFEIKQSIRTVSDFIDALKTINVSEKEISEFKKNCKLVN